MTNKIALITGANKGIGLETARQLARDHGFTVLIGARDETRGTDAANELQSEGLDAQFILLAPTDVAAVERARAEVEEKFGRLDVLVNNAGVALGGDYEPPNQVTSDVLRETFEVNVVALHEVTRAFWPLLEKSEAARLVNVSSGLGSLTLFASGELEAYKPLPLAYDASKTAVNMMTLHYASQWENTPHRANSINPGSVKTDMNPWGNLTVQEGARSSVEMATIPNDGPNGTFTHLGETVPW